MSWVKGMRDGFSLALGNIARNNKQVVLVGADTGAICHDDFKRDFPEQYINVGIAEQNMIGFAAGLAMSGKIVFTYAIIPFASMRCYEQIRIDLCCMELPVTIVGIGPGYDYSTLGPTHHGTEDISLMRALPKISIFNPSDCNMIEAIIPQLIDIPGPKYLRLDRTGLPLIYKNTKIELEQGLISHGNGRDLCIIATGRMVFSALEVAKRLSEVSIETTVVDLFRIKPLNRGLILNICNKVSHIVTLEEHFITGGIGSAISEILVEEGKGYHFLRLGIDDTFSRDYGDRDYLLKMKGLDVESILQRIIRWLDK